MTASELLERAQGLGATLSVPEPGRIHIEAPDPLPDELVEALREHKPELLKLLRVSGKQPGGCYRQKYVAGPPGTEELQEIVRRVELEGYVLCWSHAVEDFVAFYRGEKNRESIPPGFVPYRLEELSELYSESEEALSMNALKLVHEAKKRGGRVVDSTDTLTRGPQD